MTFPCVQCGLCCHEISKVPALAEYDRGDGVCRHLENKLCAVYKNRPLVCNVQAMYDFYFRAVMDGKTFIRENLMACMTLAENNPEIKSKIETFYRQEV
jgi:Fe-S-cluster containining protein